MTENTSKTSQETEQPSLRSVSDLSASHTEEAEKPYSAIKQICIALLALLGVIIALSFLSLVLGDAFSFSLWETWH